MALPPDSYGYPNAAINSVDLPIWQQPLSRFSVEGANDWKVSSLVSIDRGIRVEAGTGSGDAVTDVTKEYETMSLPKPDIAQRYYMIVRRRNWAGTGTSKLVAIPGSAAASLPKRSDKPGDESDQPLALVPVTQAESTVGKIIDLRCWAHNGGIEVVHKLALDYLGRPGASVKLGTSIFRYEAKANGVWGWKEYAEYKPPAETPPLIRSGYGGVKTNPDGFCTIGYKTRFPNGTTNAIAISMDPPGGYAAFEFVMGEPHAASFRAFASDGKALGNASVGISYVAFGH